MSWGVRIWLGGVAVMASTAACASVLAPSATAASSTPIVTPVPSLQPRATEREWTRLVLRRRSFASPSGCRPLRAVFYAPTDWLRLATKLAANASPCADYFISIPPLAGAKTTFRGDQAWRLRALGPHFHALAEVHMPAWRGWVSQTGRSWYDAGVEARRRLAAAGFDVTAGDSWIVNELSSGVRRGLTNARREVLEFTHGLYDGEGGPAAKGAVFSIGISQTGGGPDAIDLSVYKAQLQSFFEDEPFWNELGRYVGDWSQELYGDVHNYAVPSTPLAARRGSLEEWLEHALILARVGDGATAAAAFLGDAYSPLANAAWQWDVGSGFGWTMVPAGLMQQFVSAQVYALRHFNDADGLHRDHWGFAWAPHNTGLSSTAFATATAAIQERLAAAIHDSDDPFETLDAGVQACGEGIVWCQGDTAGSWLNDAWRTFGYWGRLSLELDAPARLATGGVSSPLVVRTQLDGTQRATPSALTVTFASSSTRGGFSTRRSGPWRGRLSVTIPAGGSSTGAVYYADGAAGTPTLTATAVGTGGASKTATVTSRRSIRRASTPLIKLWRFLRDRPGH